MRGESLMGYTYDEVEGYRHGASLLICFAVILMFFGGYFSAQLELKWLQISALLAAWQTFQYLGSTEVKMDFYTMIIRVTVSILIGLLFWLIFLFGFAMGSNHNWWAFLPFVLVYFISAKYIHKPYKRKH
ncbi:MAG TPA: hypothetical protein DEB73_01030 [Candidatus Magasanikbacteria bacterium]|nr:hypothetical protein [Candidatus Magasanikbacteria bacterium]